MGSLNEYLMSFFFLSEYEALPVQNMIHFKQTSAYKQKLEFVFYVKTDVSPLSTCMSKICKQEL